MIVGVDASNIRTGGGLTYFSQLLHAAEPGRNGIEKIAVWAKASTLEQLPRFPWLDLHHVPLLDRSLPYRLFWQKWLFPKLAQGCDLVFVPGSNAPYRLRPSQSGKLLLKLLGLRPERVAKPSRQPLNRRSSSATVSP